MSLDEKADGIRVITPVVFFPAGSNISNPQPMNLVEKVKGDEEPQEKAAPKGSSVPESVSSSSDPVVPEQTLKASPSPSSPVPPAPPVPNATADKGNGPPKESESSTPAG